MNWPNGFEIDITLLFHWERRQFARQIVAQNTIGSRYDQMIGLVIADDLAGGLPALGKYWRTPPDVMRVAGQYMNQPVRKHLFAPILCTLAE